MEFNFFEFVDLERILGFPSFDMCPVTKPVHEDWDWDSHGT
jgi:hypothetical protein